jgi:hypothetical protein
MTETACRNPPVEAVGATIVPIRLFPVVTDLERQLVHNAVATGLVALAVGAAAVAVLVAPVVTDLASVDDPQTSALR